MTLETAYEIINQNVSDGNEAYMDLAGTCRHLSTYVHALRVVYNKDSEQDASEVEKVLLCNLEKMLDQCADMFVQCDDYYRYY